MTHHTCVQVLKLTPWLPSAPPILPAMLCVRRLLSTPALLKAADGAMVQRWMVQLIEHSADWSYCECYHTCVSLVSLSRASTMMQRTQYYRTHNAINSHDTITLTMPSGGLSQ